MTAHARQAVTRVALVGLPGSGKSVVGEALSRRLGWRLADLDAMVEADARASIAEVFALDGEEAFRDYERRALDDALRGREPVVVACGGGLMAQPSARERVLREAVVIWLDAPDAELLHRLGAAATRPLLRDAPAEQLRTLRATRQESYAAAHLRVDTGGTDVEEVVDRIVDAVGGSRLPEPDAAVGRVRVDLGARGYTVTVGPGALRGLAATLPDGAGSVAVVADRAVGATARRAVRLVEDSGRTASLTVLRGGEAVKTWRAAGRLVERFASVGLSRTDCVVAVGGGSVGDLSGFAAATYHRGIACVHVPTTLLAMVDSAIGGKTGVNLSGGKNLAGAFWQPAAVVCDLDLLRTVPERAFRSAFAEIVKYAMVADQELAAAIDAHLDALLHRNLEALTPVVVRCIAIKAGIVGADEREAGPRAILNYGHTVGHALESITGHGDALLHGEAVAVGMRVAGALSVRHGCPPADIGWQDSVLSRCGLGTAPAVDPAALVAQTHADKKARAGGPRWVLLQRRGEASYGHELPESEVREAVDAVLAR